jgi:membrane protein involved in colicin uptake
MDQIVETLVPEVVGQQLAEVEKSSGISDDSAVALRDQFSSYYEQIVDWREKAVMVTDPADAVHQNLARDIRLGLKRIRCDVETTRKTLKADSLARGKAIDGFANVLKYLCEPIEERLLAVEQYAERQKEMRITALQTVRVQALTFAGADPLSIAAYNLGIMDEPTFNAVLAGEKQKKADREEAVRKAEAERVAREQADRIAREKAEKEAAKARAEAEKERKARAVSEAKAKADREAAEASARAEREAADAKLAKECEAREQAEREAAEAKRKEEERVAAEKAAEDAKRVASEKAARAPDREKAMAFAQDVRNLTIPKAATAAGKRVVNVIADKRDAFANWIEQVAKTL